MESPYGSKCLGELQLRSSCCQPPLITKYVQKDCFCRRKINLEVAVNPKELIGLSSIPSVFMFSYIFIIYICYLSIVLKIHPH